MTDGLDRLKVLINSSTPIVVMETSEEMRAISLVRSACSELNMATFEWSIADGLMRSGSNAPAEVHKPAPPPVAQQGGWTKVNAGTLAQPHTALSVLGIVIGMIESAMARYRLLKVPQFIVGAATLSVVGFIVILV